jgi:hypothetical protein
MADLISILKAQMANFLSRKFKSSEEFKNIVLIHDSTPDQIHDDELAFNNLERLLFCLTFNCSVSFAMELKFPFPETSC